MQEKLLQRFLRYVAVPSQSNAANANVPSSEGQRKLAELLKQDLAELGLVDIEGLSAGRLHQRGACCWLVRSS